MFPYQEPKQGVSCCSSYQIQPLNYANIESFRFLLTQLRLWTSGAACGEAEDANLESAILAPNMERGR